MCVCVVFINAAHVQCSNTPCQAASLSPSPSISYYANTDTDKVAILPTVNCLPKCISLSVYQIDVY